MIGFLLSKRRPVKAESRSGQRHQAQSGLALEAHDVVLNVGTHLWWVVTVFRPDLAIVPPSTMRCPLTATALPAVVGSRARAVDRRSWSPLSRVFGVSVLVAR